MSSQQCGGGGGGRGKERGEEVKEEAGKGDDELPCRRSGGGRLKKRTETAKLLLLPRLPQIWTRGSGQCSGVAATVVPLARSLPRRGAGFIVRLFFL